MTEASSQARSVLRSTENLQWSVAPFLVLTLYVYIGEIERKNWSSVLLGIYSFANGMVLEIVNALILLATGYAALWLGGLRGLYRNTAEPGRDCGAGVPALELAENLLVLSCIRRDSRLGLNVDVPQKEIDPWHRNF